MRHLRPDRIYTYLEGDLSLTERNVIERHTRTCSACRMLMEEREALHAAWTALPPLEVPADFASTVMRRLRTKPLPSLRTWVIAVLSVFTSFAFVIFGALGIAGTAQISLVTGLNRSLLSLLSHVLILTLKIIKAGTALLDITGDLVARLSANLSVPVTAFSGEIAVLAVLVLILSGLLALGFRKRLLPGDQP